MTSLAATHPTRTRLLEILPGALTWTTLILPFILSFHYPWLVALFALVYDLYWFFRSLQLTINIVRSYRRMRLWKHTNWHDRLTGGHLPQKTANDAPTVATVIKPDDLIHVVFLIFYKESYELLERSIASYAESDLPKKKLWLVLAAEERAGDYGPKIAKRVEKQFGRYFDRVILSLHPAHIPGEIKSKSSNATYAGKQLKKILDDMGKPYDQVIIHNFDADTRVYPEYFNAVACTYLSSELGVPTSFQPIHVYANNIWDTPALMRLVAQSSSTVFMNNMLRPYHFHHFSSRSDVFSTIVTIGYWTVDAIPEDSRQYYDSFFRFGNRMRVEPIYVPLRMDAVLADGYWRTVQNQYRQLRRWAWGVVDFPYIVNKALADHDIPWSAKLAKILFHLESNYSWATSAIFITFVGWIPFVLNPGFSHTVIGYNFPNFARIILGGALVGMVATVIVSLALLPPKPKHKHHLSYAGFVFQWFLSPIASIFVSAFAAIDAQTRLMLGHHMEYQVTEKSVAKN